jgi:hypothetical protein
MELASRLNGIGSIITAGVNLYQTAEYSKRAQAQEQTRHEQEMELMRQQHRSEMITAKQTYLISTFTDIEQFCQELNENLLNSTKDAERDMVDQRNRQFQTILLAGTIMIASVMNILIQGPVPDSANEFSKIAYSFTNCASVFFIGVSMLICIQLVYRVTQFMYRRSELNLTQLRDAMGETRKMMRKIRGDEGNPDVISIHTVGLQNVMAADDEGPEPQGAAGDDGSEEKEEQIEADDQYAASGIAGIAFRQPKKAQFQESTAGVKTGRGGVPLKQQASSRSHISTLTADELEKQWREHEAEVHAYLNRRSAINERREMLRFGAVSFEHFWNTSCKDSGSVALISFYVGTSMMLLATMVYFWNTYLLVYTCSAGAITAVVTIGVSLVVTLGFAVYLRFFDPSINNMRDDTTSLITASGLKQVQFSSLMICIRCSALFRCCRYCQV